MYTKKILLAALFSCLFAPAWAEDADAGQHAGASTGGADLSMINGGNGPMMPTNGKLVKNLPYVAKTVRESQRNLADGNQINYKVGILYQRDSNGNLRMETLGTKGEPIMISINKPASGDTILLYPAKKTGTRISIDMEAIKAYALAAGAAAAREAAGKEGKPVKAERKAGEEAIVKRVERPDRGQPLAVVQVRAAPNYYSIHHGTPSTIADALDDVKWAAKATTKDLGSKEIAGVKAEGKLRSYEIPPGEVGNRNAIVVTDETWYSPALQLTLYTKHSDPRAGDETYRVTSLKREEPAAALFTAPSDYTIKEEVIAIGNKGQAENK